MNLKSRAIIFLVPVLLMAGGSKAQEAGAGEVFSLEQCIEYALTNSVNSQNAGIDERIAEAKVKETVGLGLPQISGSASLMHNQQLARFFGTYSGSTEGFSFFPAGIPGAQPGDILAAQNFFQLKNAGDVSLGLTQLIFNGSYLVGLKAANTYKELAAKANDQTREQIIQQVTKAYYSVLINNERIGLFTNNIARIDTLLNSTQKLNQAGFAENIDVDRIRVAYNNLITERDKFLNINQLGIALLKFQMNYPMDQPLALEGSIADIDVSASMEAYRQDWDYKNRPDYQLLEVNRQLQELNIRNIYAAMMPSIVGFANLGFSTQSNTFGGIFTTNSAVEDNDIVGPDKWYRYTNLGLSMSIPIFSGMQSKYRLQQEKMNLLKIENGFQVLSSSIDLEISQASINYENALKTLESQKENQDLAGNIARVTKIKYEQGVGSNIEVIDAESSLKQAQTNYYNALFDAMVAKVDLDKAYGKLLPSSSNEN